MDEKTPLKDGWYWVRLRYQVKAKEWVDKWSICRFEDGEWTECGTDQYVPAHAIVDIDPKRLQRKHDSEVEPDGSN